MHRGPRWLTDVAGLTRVDAVELMRWSAQALLRSAHRWPPIGTTEKASIAGLRRPPAPPRAIIDHR
jgi:hypothetical protein